MTRDGLGLGAGRPRDGKIGNGGKPPASPLLVDARHGPVRGIKRRRSRCLRPPASGRFSPSANVAYRVLNRHSRPAQPGGRATLQPDCAEWLRCADSGLSLGGRGAVRLRRRNSSTGREKHRRVSERKKKNNQVVDVGLGRAVGHAPGVWRSRQAADPRAALRVLGIEAEF